MSEVYFSIGTNVGKRIENLIEAVEGLQTIIQNIKISDVYETEPWGYESQEPFLNICVVGLTVLEPEKLLKKVKSLEKEIGREETFKWGPRKIDIDLLFIDDLIIKKNDLEIPHQGIAERAFVLIPFMDINSNFMHPILKKRIQELASEIGTDGVKKFEIQPF